MDSGRRLTLNVKDNPHLNYGNAVTSHSSQGQTADRMLVHVDTEQAGEKLVNRPSAYVAVSRGRYDAQLYTNDKGQLAGRLSRDVSHRSAMEPTRAFRTFRSAALSRYRQIRRLEALRRVHPWARERVGYAGLRVRLFERQGTIDAFAERE
jgi:hypothetical protein